MIGESTPPEAPYTPRAVVDYDGQGYDYRRFWKGRDYERWAEDRVLRRVMPMLGRPRWFADFGGGFGRNARHYRGFADHTLLIDYSTTNLERAAADLAPDVTVGRIHLIRADINHLPLIDGGVDAAMVVRVLHHLTDVDAALTEMGRTVARRWLVDVPIKHHALGRMRRLARRTDADLNSPEPLVTGSTDYPFRTYHLATVRATLDANGWDSVVTASVNNFRRWDQVLPAPAVRGLRPVVYGMEIVAQRTGRGWWGPAQFLVARRRHLHAAELAPPPEGVDSSVADLARRLQCPTCAGSLSWSATAATCAACGRMFVRRGLYWDFVVE